MASFFQILLNNLHMIGILALTTLGLTLTYKTANTTNFSQSITATMGAFAAAYFVMMLGLNPWLATLAGVVICFLIGMIIDAVIIRRATTGGNGRVMVTLGLITLFSAFIPMIFGMIPYDFGRFFPGTLTFQLFGAELTVTKNGLFIFIASFAIIGIIFLALNLTKWGLGVRSTASNIRVASLMGINVHRITALSWGISGALGALGAIFYASQTTNVGVDMLTNVQANSLLALVLGGYTSFYGPVLGAILITVANMVFALFSSLWANAILYAAILLAVLIRPRGLFGKETLKKV